MPLSLRQKNFLNWSIVVLWLAALWLASSQPSLHSDFDLTTDTLGRKVLHFLLYFALCYWWQRANRSSNFQHPLGLALLFACLYAALDEYHQTFVAGRQGSLVDWSIDSLGAFLYYFLSWRKINWTIF